MGRLRSTAAAALFVTLSMPAISSHQVASAHPLHTSLAELSFDRQSRTLEVSLRVFVDDFTAASVVWHQTSTLKTTASPLVGYARSVFTVREANGTAVDLASCGGKRVGDLMWLCFRGHLTGEPAGLSVASQVLFGKYKDQINVVQADFDGRKSNLLFTPGDRTKKLR
ncbi:MAG: DUF6702 family protein [Gemmatimonadaceae bacterium]